MSDSVKECVFRQVPEAGFFVEIEAKGYDPNESYELSEKYDDFETIVIGNIRGEEIELCRRPASKMIPRSDCVESHMRVAVIPREWVLQARAALAALPAAETLVPGHHKDRAGHR